MDETGALLTTDQRGLLRMAGVRCDASAFEYSPLGALNLPLVVRWVREPGTYHNQAHTH